jgi:hypothetical protein
MVAVSPWRGTAPSPGTPWHCLGDTTLLLLPATDQNQLSRILFGEKSKIVFRGGFCRERALLAVESLSRVFVNDLLQQWRDRP